MCKIVHVTRIGICAVAILLSPARQAFADVAVPDIYIESSGAQGTFSTPGFFGGTICQVGTNICTTDHYGTFGSEVGGPGVQADGSTLGKQFNSASHAYLTYYFAVNGADGLSVPIILTGKVTTTAVGTYTTSTEGYGSINSDGGLLSFCSFSGTSAFNPCQGQQAEGTVTQSFKLLTNTLSVVGLEAAEGVLGGTGQASAVVDPMISIDPTFLASHPGLTLSFSPDLGLVVPEPDSLPLMVGGLLALGIRGWRRMEIEGQARPLDGYLQ